MILRISDILGKKIAMEPTALVPLNANPYADWSCHCFTVDRTPYILAANTASLYAVLFTGRRIARRRQFESLLMANLQTQLLGDGFEFLYKRLIDAQGGEISYSRPLNPRLIGAINDLAEMAQFYLEVDAVRPEAAAERINRSPLSIIGHAHPRDAFRSLSFRA